MGQINPATVMLATQQMGIYAMGGALANDAATANDNTINLNGFNTHWATDNPGVDPDTMNDKDDTIPSEYLDGISPISGYHYSAAQVTWMINYVANQAQGKSGEDLTKMQLILNQWQTKQSEMNAVQGIPGAQLKNAVDTYTSQVQTDQSNQSSMNSTYSTTMNDLAGIGASVLGAGVA